MTFEQVLVKYLYMHKQVTLQGIGTISLVGEVPDNEYVNKNRHIPIEGISLSFDQKAGLDEGFTLFFSEERGKIKPLAQSDIESSLQLARQMINIGKAYEIEGIGSIAKQSNGILVLHPGYYAVTYPDGQQVAVRLKERVIENEPPKRQLEDNGSTVNPATKRLLIIVASILTLAVASWLVWSQMKSPATANASDSEMNADTTLNAKSTTGAVDNTNGLSPDSGLMKIDSSVALMVADTNLVQTWKAYFRTFDNKANALKGFANYKATQNPPMLETTDSVNFKLYVLLQSRISDTTYKKDSMRKFYASPITLIKP